MLKNEKKSYLNNHNERCLITELFKDIGLELFIIIKFDIFGANLLFFSYSNEYLNILVKAIKSKGHL